MGHAALRAGWGPAIVAGVAWGGGCWSDEPIYNSSGSYIGQALRERLFVAPGAPRSRDAWVQAGARAIPCRRGCRARDPVPIAPDVSRRLQHAVDKRDSDLELFVRRFLFSRKPTASKLTDWLMSRLPPHS